VAHDGSVPIGWWSLDVVGPIARTATTLADAFAVLAARPAPDPADGSPVRVGVDWRWWGRPAPAVDARCREVAAALGAEPVSVAHLDLARPALYATAAGEIAAATADIDLARFSPDVATTIGAARSLRAMDYLRAQQVRTLLSEAFAEVFATVDVIVSPTTAGTAAPLHRLATISGLVDEPLLRQVTAYTFPANLAGLPAATVPVGVDEQGLPIGFQIMGAPGADDLVLRVAARLERDGLASSPRPRGWVGAAVVQTGARMVHDA
jgi:aspartyl-tRNA(Asn)/glutamyl-tRNA(Gln) amidotransferase subunit A